MARRWTQMEEDHYRKELMDLYVHQNKTIGEIGSELGLSESTVFDRLQRLEIPSQRHLKKNSNNQREVTLPEKSESLAEFIGIMLGDGHISHFQIIVTLGTKELSYVEYVQQLMASLFCTEAYISVRSNGYRDVYIGSTKITSWLMDMGMVSNKVATQVNVPSWIFEQEVYMEHFLRGFFDTDGSVYRLRFGIQISLTNHSLPILDSLHSILIRLGYTPSAISGWRVYITRRTEVVRFFEEIKPANSKHCCRYEYFTGVGR